MTKSKESKQRSNSRSLLKDFLRDKFDKIDQGSEDFCRTLDGTNKLDELFAESFHLAEQPKGLLSRKR